MDTNKRIYSTALPRSSLDGLPFNAWDDDGDIVTANYSRVIFNRFTVWPYEWGKGLMKYMRLSEQITIDITLNVPK